MAGGERPRIGHLNQKLTELDRTANKKTEGLSRELA